MRLKLFNGGNELFVDIFEENRRKLFKSVSYYITIFFLFTEELNHYYRRLSAYLNHDKKTQTKFVLPILILTILNLI